MEKDEVYLIMSELNGYKCVHGVFRDKQEAIECGDALIEDWHFKNHAVYIQTMNLL